jgi:hypothetical protein
MSGTAQMSVGVGFMLGTLFVSYPFAIGEKNGLDALYVTLSVNRKTVVLGRYLFVLALNLCAVLGSFVCASFGLFAARSAGLFESGWGGGDSFSLIAAFVSLMIVIQIIQLPIFFKVGYTKAKFLSIVPFAALMAGFSAFQRIAKGGGVDGLSGFLAAVSENKFAVPLATTVLVLAVCVSYRLSLAFYKKRGF